MFIHRETNETVYIYVHDVPRVLSSSPPTKVVVEARHPAFRQIGRRGRCHRLHRTFGCHRHLVGRRRTTLLAAKKDAELEGPRRWGKVLCCRWSNVRGVATQYSFRLFRGDL